MFLLLNSVVSQSDEGMLASRERREGGNEELERHFCHHEELVASLTIRKAFVALLYKVSVEEGFQGQH